MSDILGKKKPVALIVLDGWGQAPVWGGNAIGIAQVKTFDTIFRKYPHTTLNASGEAVGLTPDAPGNSEAGHLNIGAGTIVHQDQPIIDKEIESGNFFKNDILLKAFSHAKENKSSIHIMGLLSKTGTHSQIEHLYPLLEMAKQQDFHNVFIHLFTDGRDSDAMSGIEMISEVENKINEIAIGQISSIVGRYYAMDRDNRWDRIQKAYDLLVSGQGKSFERIKSIFSESYSRNVTDEFIEPSIVANKQNSFHPISDNDSVIFFNFRYDRALELTRAFVDKSLTEIPNRRLLQNLYFVSFIMQGADHSVEHPFRTEGSFEPISKIWADLGLRQYHTAESEKYAQVTYFFDGAREGLFPGEDSLMIPSDKSVKTYDEKPEMSAKELTDNLIEVLKKDIYDCFVINYANPDMVGHTGNLDATVKAVEFVDKCLERFLNELLPRNGTAFIFADHGNAEQMVNPRTGEPDTEHTTNPVPFIIVSEDEKIKSLRLRDGGMLASIVPTVLEIQGIDFDKSKKEKSLIVHD